VRGRRAFASFVTSGSYRLAALHRQRSASKWRVLVELHWLELEVVGEAEGDEWSSGSKFTPTYPAHGPR
jgi:hypothetical protein